MGRYVWMAVTNDSYELPVAIADTVQELSRITGASRNTIIRKADPAVRPDVPHRLEGEKKRDKYVRVEIEGEDEDDEV